MKLIHMVIHEMNMTGVPTAAVNLANSLPYDVKIIVIGEKPNYVNFDNSVFLGIKRGKGILGKIRYTLQSLFILAKYLRKEKVQNLFVWSKEFAAISVIIKPHYTKLIGVNATDMQQSIESKRFSLLTGKIYSFLLKKVAMIAQSNALLEGMSKYGLENITVIYPPLNEKFFSPFPKGARQEFKAVWIGSLTDIKQPNKAIQICIDLGLPLEIIGEGKLSNSLIKSPIIFPLGNKENIIPYIENARLLIHTSKHEGFGMVLAEAAARGIPVIAFNCPVGPAEIIQSYKNGYLAKNQDIDDMKRGIKYILERQWNKTEIQNTVLKFHPINIIPKYIKLIDKIFT